MVVSDAINNIMGGMESTAGVRLHNHRRKLRQRFDIIKKLGQGTYGKVQLGINKETGQEVAIKTIKKSKIETEADLVRIRREIQIMSSVQHPNIIHIYEVFENREKMVLVMEYAAGGELYDFLSERKVLAEAEARRIFRQIATAVFYCHKHNICHRDLKLENILLDEHGAAKIADFGLSNVFDDQRLLATFCGSPLYASPEIVRGTPYRGPEVDCWSLGVLLYTLVYGAMPFDGSNFKRLVKQISNGEYFEPKKPSPASGLIRAMLCVDPAVRADISAVCSDTWINEGAGHTCFELAEELAAQTPVRLDLLLSLAPATTAPPAPETTPAEPLARCRSVGALMELDKARTLAEPAQRRSSAAGQEPGQKDAVAAKRKLEEGSSTDEANTGAKRKERTSRRRDRSAERTGERKTRSASRSKQTKPKTEEPVPQGTNENPPESMEVDVESKPVLEVKEDKCEPAAKVEAEETKITDDAKKVKVKRKKKVTEDGSKEDVSVSESSQVVEKPQETVAVKESEVVQVQAEDVKPVEPEKPKVVKKTGAIKKKVEPVKAVEEEVAKPMVRRRSKIFESEIQKFNNMEPKSPVVEKPKKVFIPGVKVSDFKKAYERKSSVDLSSAANLKTSPSKTSVEKTESEAAVEPEPVAKPAEPVATKIEPVPAKVVPVSEQNEPVLAQSEPVVAQNEPVLAQTEPISPQQAPVSSETAGDKPASADLAKLKKNAIEIIGNAIAKPPKPVDKTKVKTKSPPESPRSEMNKVLESLKTPDSTGKKTVKVQVGPNDVRNAVLQVSTPELVENFKFEERDRKTAEPQPVPVKDESSDRPKVSTKVEITLKSATLPRRKTSKAEIRLESPPAPPKPEFRTQVQHTVQAVGPKLPTQRSEVAFPVAAAQNTALRSMSVEPESASRDRPKERIIPIQFAREPDDRPPLQTQRSNQSNQSARSSLSRQSTLDSEPGDSVPASAEALRKSPREFIIPIAVEGGGFITPRAASLEPGAGPTAGAENKKKPLRFGRPLRMSSLLSESDDDCFSPFSPGGRQRDGDSSILDDEFGAHMHQLRSSRPSRFPTERADSVSSGEDDDDDNFELLTAESLFSTLLSRVRNLTQRLNTDDGRPSFPTSRFMNHNFPSRSSFFSEPLSRRVSETSQFSRQSSRDRSCDRDSNHSSSTLRSGNSGSTLPRSGNSGSTLPRSGNSAASLPRALRTDSSSSLYTPSLSRRLMANHDAALPRNSSHSSLPTSRAATRPVSRTGSLKSSENKPRPPPSYLHRCGSESFQGNRGYDRFGESPSLGYDSGRTYESPTSAADLQRTYQNPSRPYESPSRFYGHSSRPYESYPLPYERTEAEDAYGPPSHRPLAANSTNSLPRRHTYRSSMSDTVATEPLPPLPSRRLPRSSSYLRQRALDIANVYSAPLAADEDRAERLADFRARRAGSVSREQSLARDEDLARRQKISDGSDRVARPTSLDLRATPERSVLGKLLGDQEPGAVSPVKSPGRRVSRFLRPDFYDTAREDSAFVKVKAEQERARANGNGQLPVGRSSSYGSRQQDVANFLETNCADLKRNIAEGLRAIGENADKSPAVKVSDRKVGVADGTAELREKKDVTKQPVCLDRPGKVDDLSEGSVAKRQDSEKRDVKENGMIAPVPKAKDSGKIAGKSERKVVGESSVKDGDSKDASVEASKENCSEKSEAKVKVVKVLSAKKLEPPKSGANFEKVAGKETVVEVKDKKLPEAVGLEDEVVSPVKTQVAVKTVTKDTVTKAAASNLPVREIPKKSVENVQENLEVKTQNGGSAKSVAGKSSASAEEAPTKLPTKIKLKKKVKKDPESSPKEVTEEAKTNRSKFMRTLDKTIDKLEEIVKPCEAPSASTTVAVDDRSETRSPNKIKRVIDSLKELATSPKVTPDTENSLLKRATSVDDMTNPSQTKSNQVSSMLGRFRKLEEPKKSSLLSRFRKTQSVYGGSTSDGCLALDGDVGKRASLGPDSFEAFNDASCSVIVRRNSVKKVDEKVDADPDVSISATVKVVKVVKDEPANGMKLPGSKSNGDVKKVKHSVVEGESYLPDKPAKKCEPVENGAGRKADLKNGTSSPKLVQSKSANFAKSGESNAGQNGSVPKTRAKVGGSEVNVLEALVGDDGIDSSSISSERTSPRPSSPCLDGPAESIEARILRKSFYSRFNDSKKQPARKVSMAGLRNSGSSTAFEADAMQ